MSLATSIMAASALVSTLYAVKSGEEAKSDAESQQKKATNEAARIRGENDLKIAREEEAMSQAQKRKLQGAAIGADPLNPNIMTKSQTAPPGMTNTIGGTSGKTVLGG